MGKMEAAGEILGNMQLHNSKKTPESGKYSESMERMGILRKQITMLYLSCRKEIPGDDILDVEVHLANQELVEIPDGELEAAFTAAKVEAGAFLPSNGLIVKVWRGKGAKSFEEAAKAIRDENNKKYLGWSPANMPTPEEREANAKAAAEIARKLAGKA